MTHKTKAGRRFNRPVFSIVAICEDGNSTEESDLGRTMRRSACCMNSAHRTRNTHSAASFLVGVFFFAKVLLDVVEAQFLFVGAEGLLLDLLALFNAVVVVIEHILAIL